MRRLNTRTISRRRNASVQSVISRVRPVAGAKDRTIVRNSAKPIARRNVLRVVVSDRSHVNVVIYSAPAAALDQRSKTVWPVVTSMMTVFASKNAPQCKNTIPPITFGSRIQMVNMHMVRRVYAIAPSIC